MEFYLFIYSSIVYHIQEVLGSFWAFLLHQKYFRTDPANVHKIREILISILYYLILIKIAKQ